MSSSRRPWYPWYPRDYNQDEKVRMLSDDAELIYRRALDVLWQANDLQLPSNCYKLANALARGWDTKRFELAWSEIQTPGFELLKTTDDGLWVYSKRLKKEAEKIESLCQQRKIIGKKGGQAKAKQLVSKSSPKALANGYQNPTHTDTDTDINKKRKIIKRKGQIPPDFSLSETMLSFAIKKGIDKRKAESVFEHFKTHHTAKGTLMIDWEAAWRTWCINDGKFGNNGNSTKLTEQEMREREAIDRKYRQQA